MSDEQQTDNDISHVVIRVNPNFREDITAKGPYSKSTAETLAAYTAQCVAVEVFYPPEIPELADLPLDIYKSDEALHEIADQTSNVVLLISTADDGEQRYAAFGPFSTADLTLVVRTLHEAHSHYHYVSVKVTR